MSKIGKKTIEIPTGVQIEVKGNELMVTGPKGSLTKKIPGEIKLVIEDNDLKLETQKKDVVTNMKYGTTRSLVANAVKGVFTGWTKVMELVGTGYRAEVKGNELILTVGFSHPVVIKAPEEIAFKVEKSEIIVESVDKETLGLVCSKIRSVRPPEPYKGKGIRYKDEVIRRKAGKAAKAAGA